MHAIIRTQSLARCLSALMLIALAIGGSGRADANGFVGTPPGGGLPGMPGGDSSAPNGCSTGYCGTGNKDSIDSGSGGGGGCAGGVCGDAMPPPRGGGGAMPGAVGAGKAPGGGAPVCTATSCSIGGGGGGGSGFDPLKCGLDLCSTFGSVIGGVTGKACQAASAISNAAQCLQNLTPCDKKNPDRMKDLVMGCLGALCDAAGVAGSDVCDNPISGIAGQLMGGGNALSSCGVIGGVEWVLRQCNIQSTPTGIEIIPPPEDESCVASGKVCCSFSKPGRACNACCAIHAERAGDCGCPQG